MNRPLLIKVRDHILEHPEEFDMAHWICKSVGCIAGQAILLSRMDQLNGSYFKNAKTALDISYEQASSLFYVSDWPLKFKAPFWIAAKGKPEARIAAERINHFLETGE